MIAVLAANNSKVDALSTTATLRPKPPDTKATSEINRSLWVALISAGSKLIDSSVSRGEVITVVVITPIMAHFAVRLSGKRMFGLSWLILSKPENASQAAPNPTRSSLNERVGPGAKLCSACHHWAGENCQNDI